MTHRPSATDRRRRQPQRPTPRRGHGIALGITAIALEAAAVATIAASTPLPLGNFAVPGVPIAAGLHLLAAWAAAAADLDQARQPATGTSSRSTRIYRDARFWCALLLPALGPTLAWLILRQPPAGMENAHAFFENYEEEVHSVVALEDRVAEGTRRSAPMSFQEVLRHGSLDHRRNALRKLAERGGSLHMGLLRQCLSHRNMEMRLGAFSEVNRLLRAWERRIGDIQQALIDAPDDVDRRIALCRAHREYAASGLLDSDMSQFQLEKAIQSCEEASEEVRGNVGLAVERALVALELENPIAATRALRDVDAQHQNDSDVLIARARIAFAERRYRDAVEEIAPLQEHGVSPPRWLDELEATIAPYRHPTTSLQGVRP